MELWTLGEKRDGLHDVDHRVDGVFRPRRDDPDEDQHRGTRRQRSSLTWNRVSRCRGAVGDYYSSTRHRGNSYSQPSYHSRHNTPPTSWKHEGVQQEKNKKKWIAKTKKRVSFANPLVQVFGEFHFDELSLFTKPAQVLNTVGYDPMLEEILLHYAPIGPNGASPAERTKEDRIREMLGTPGWDPVASPVADDGLEKDELREPEKEEYMHGSCPCDELHCRFTGQDSPCCSVS